ncbi:MAG: cellulase family glycosylhydrolase [Myxococcota bacterium]|nr:cellulase family glycosylhydrolase [Myxococcota bacterium]
MLALLAGLAAACADDGTRITDGTAVNLDATEVTGLRVAKRRIVDDQGRTVVLRALQHHELQDVDYGGREVLASDYPRIAAWGFTTLRVAVSWSALEPVRGSYAADYVARLRGVLDHARAAQLGVILEWHHDLWGRCTQTADSRNRASANGAPDWTCPAELGTGGFVHWDMFDRLYANADGLEDSYLAAWAHLLGEVGDHPALVGVEPFNEPQGNGGTPGLERDELYPAYRRWVPHLRAAGARGLMFLDAPILRNEITELHVEPLATLDADAVFAPHLYSGWLRMYVLDSRISPAVKAADFAAAADQATQLGLPLWNGEWGVNLLLPGALDDLATHVALEDAHRIGSSYWAFQRVAVAETWATGPQALLAADGSPHREVLQLLSRPYPIATPGELVELSTEAGLHLRYLADPDVTAPLVIFLPPSHLGATPCLEVRVDGRSVRWRYTRLADDRYALAFDSGSEVEVDATRCR